MASVNEIKKMKGRGHPGPQQLGVVPRSGTFIRMIYDILRTSAPTEVVFSHDKKNSNAFHATLAQLRDFYGCDIVKVKRNTYRLVGEYIGDTYVDYRTSEQPDRSP